MKIWIHVDGRQLGPFDIDELPLEDMTAATPIWYNGLTRWTPAGEAPATAELFAPAPVQVDVEAEQVSVDSEEASPSKCPPPLPRRTARSAGMGGETPKCPPSYLVWSILLTICCCNVVGIIPIITGAQVTSRFNNQDFEGAQRASYTTEWWVIIAFVIGLISLPFTILINL